MTQTYDAGCGDVRARHDIVGYADELKIVKVPYGNWTVVCRSLRGLLVYGEKDVMG